ncbi:MAG: response regulator transcription factor [Thermodesulfobacteriota bacterium]
MPAEPKKLLIIEDHPLFREGLKAILNRDPLFVIAGEAGSGAEGLRLARGTSPDVVVMDISLPDMSGIEATRRLLEAIPSARVMMVSFHSGVDYIADAFAAGATGYLVKESAAEKLLHGLHAVARGESYLDSSVSAEVVRKLRSPEKRKDAGADDAYAALTAREQEVMRLVVEGLSTKAIAERLFVSAKTVENHRANLMKKLGLSSTIELVRYAARLGLIDIEDWVE